LKILFAGTPANAAQTMRALLGGNHEVVAVLTRPDAPVGRKRILTPSATALVAQEAGIQIFKADRVTPELARELAATGAEVGVIVAYGALLKNFALQALPKGWVNLHYSLLPDWRGAAPVQNSILAGDTDTGVTLFQLDSGMDTGGIIDVVRTNIQVGETSGRLLERLTQLGITLLNQALPAIESGLTSPQPQPDQPSYSNQTDRWNLAALPIRPASKPTREQAHIDWSKSALEIERLVLAMNPEPMAFSSLSNEPFRIIDAAALGSTDWSALESESETTHSPGNLRFEPKRLLVECGAGTLLQLKIVQPAGKNPMQAMDWARGAAGKHLNFDFAKESN
jgi:methionyl-tRNA formyltransferase